jgi:SAM-dependent methyltransferase
MEFFNTRVAEEIVPQIIKFFNPNSVVDVGCGIGTWLHVFKSLGIKDILGIEGDHLDTNLLMIDKEDILFLDLEKEFVINRKFDIALSLEVAEHLSAEAAANFIQSLAKLSNVIIFSAAIPGQEGQGHINEQWMDYWQMEFQKNDFEFYDLLRPLFWNNEKVDWWYRQNIIVAIRKGIPNDFSTNHFPLNIVHPKLFEYKNEIIRDLAAKNKDLLNNLRKAREEEAKLKKE